MLLSPPEQVQIFADYIVCLFWVIAYIFALKSTLKEKVPTIPPYATVAILPWEFLAFLQTLPALTTYITIARRGWFLLHFAIFIVAIYKLYRNKPKIIILLVTAFLTITIALYYVFQSPFGQIRTSFLNTIICWLFLIYHIIKSDYPPTRRNLAFAVFGFLADAAGHFIYLDEDYITSFLCILLQIIQLIHVILVWRLLRKAKVKLIESPEVIRSYLEKEKKAFDSHLLTLNRYLKSKLIPQQTQKSPRKYKKKKKTKKTHRTK